MPGRSTRHEHGHEQDAEAGSADARGDGKGSGGARRRDRGGLGRWGYGRRQGERLRRDRRDQDLPRGDRSGRSGGACGSRPRGGKRSPPQLPRADAVQAGRRDGRPQRTGPTGPLGRIRGVFSPLVDNLIAQLSRFPGVGTRTAQRLAFHLLRVSKEEAFALADAIREVKERIGFCRECGNLTEEELCLICKDTRRDHSIICVVEQPADLLSVERTHEFRGVYHVLGGALSPLDGVEPQHLRIDELLGRVERNGVEEVVLATNPNMTGEATAAYLADRLRDRTRVTRLASGLPVGGDLEYADEVTLGRALSGRREM